jgi:hypothetical protein
MQNAFGKYYSMFTVDFRREVQMKNKIEKLRTDLNNLIDEKGICSEEVLILSKKLDHIINKHYFAVKDAGERFYQESAYPVSIQ